MRWWAAGLGGALALAPAEAHADEDFDLVVAGVTLFGVVAATDVGFAVHDAVLFAEERQPHRAVAIAETAVSAPQTIVAHFALAALAHERGDDALKLILTGPGMLVSALTTHGVWSLARPDEAPNVLFGASTVIGINSLWTTVSLSNAFDGHMPRVPTGALQIVTSGPAAAWSIAEAVRGDSFQSGWIALSAWSGAVVLHGVANVVIGDEADEIARAPARALGLDDLHVGPSAIPEGGGVSLSARF